MTSENPRRISLIIVGEDRTKTLLLNLLDRAVVGRGAESDEQPPELDLNPFGGAKSGVSRVHAAFSLDGEQVCIEDLDSTSGTRLNGLPLTPRERYRLRSQDELEFGRVRVTVKL
jgi:pSer/pThr/pTyr-binding forkhead associated (FHA) protein